MFKRRTWSLSLFFCYFAISLFILSIRIYLIFIPQLHVVVIFLFSIFQFNWLQEHTVWNRFVVLWVQESALLCIFPQTDEWFVAQCAIHINFKYIWLLPCRLDVHGMKSSHLRLPKGENKWLKQGFVTSSIVYKIIKV